MRSTARGAVGRQSQAQQRLRCHRSVNLPGVVAAIGPNQVEPRDAAASLIENQTGPVAVLNRGKVDNDPRRQPLAVDQGVDLAALYLLAGVVTHLVVATSFFGRFDRLAVENPRRGAGLPTHSLVQCHMQLGPDRLPDAIALELAKRAANSAKGSRSAASTEWR